MVITVEAYDWNCPQHIPQRFTLAELAEAGVIEPGVVEPGDPTP